MWGPEPTKNVPEGRLQCVQPEVLGSCSPVPTGARRAHADMQRRAQSPGGVSRRTQLLSPAVCICSQVCGLPAGWMSMCLQFTLKSTFALVQIQAADHLAAAPGRGWWCRGRARTGQDTRTVQASSWGLRTLITGWWSPDTEGEARKAAPDVLMQP